MNEQLTKLTGEALEKIAKAQDLDAYRYDFKFATDHIFRYAPVSEDWKNITVTATDPFGNVYQDSIDH